MKDISERAEYVGVLLSLATYKEKILPSQKEQVAIILKNYQVPDTYLDEIWKKINSKKSIEDIVGPIEERDINYKLTLLQELAYFFLANGTYNQRKVLIHKVAGIFGMQVDLEGLKKHVLELANKKSNPN